MIRLYGKTALARCRDILAIFSNAANQSALDQELRIAATHDDQFWETPVETDEYGDPKDTIFLWS